MRRLGLTLFIYLSFSGIVFGDYDFDRKYALETIGALRAYDNIDDVFGDYIKDAYARFFERNSRFVYVSIDELDEVLKKSNLAYEKVISNNSVLEQVARSARIESLIRTKVIKEGPKYRVLIDWLHAPNMDSLGSVSFYYYHVDHQTAIGEKRLQEEVSNALNELFDQLPFKGHVTGIDGNAVTLNLGRDTAVRKDDTLVIGSLVQVRKHPLLGKLVDWKSKYVARVKVTAVEEKICFGEIVEIADNSSIEKYQKVIEIIPAKDPLFAPVVGDEAIDPSSGKTISGYDDDSGEAKGWQPRYGWVGGGIWIGALDRQYSDTAVNYDGGGLLFGSKLEGQAWLNKKLFLELQLGAGFNSFSQEDVKTGYSVSGTTGSGTATVFELGMGYYYHLDQSFFGPKGWVKLGYHSRHYSLARDTSTYTSATTYSGMFIGVGGDLPFQEKWGAYFTFDFGLFKGVDDDIVTSGAASVTDFSVFLGGYYRFSEKVMIRSGLDVQANGADFDGGKGLTHKIIGLTGKLLYFF